MPHVGPFELVEPVARGGMAEVWRGFHRSQGIPVAVKVVTGALSKQDRYRLQFKNEVRAVARLGHPGVVHILDHGEIDAATERLEPRLSAGSPYLVTEWASGGTLFTQKGSFAWADLRSILLDLLDALGHAHARGVIHRDVKPGNVLFCTHEDLRPGLKLTDFGIAHGNDLPAQNPEDDRSGTLHYMSPEQLLGLWRDQGPWTDLYAVGCLAWRCSMGNPPFHGRTGEALVSAQLTRDPPRLKPREPVPAGFEAWLNWLLQKQPRDRFLCAADAAVALIRLGEPVTMVEPLVEHQDDGESTAVLRPWRPGPPPIPATWEKAKRGADSSALVGAGLGLIGLRTIPLVGRRAERTVLWDALRKVHKEGRVEVVVLHGTVGVGKSALVDWVATRAAEAGAATVIKATCDSQASSGAALARLIERHAKAGGLGREAVRERLATALNAEVDSFEVDVLVDIVLPDPDRTRNPEVRAAAIRRFLARLCQQRPVVLWLDDGTRDPDVIGLAADLLRMRDAMRLPILVVITARDDVPEDYKRIRDLHGPRDGLTMLPLGRLPPADQRQLVQELLVLDATLAADLEARTDGNPMYAVELVRELVQRGSLEPGTGGFRVPAGVQPQLPDDLHQVWLARIDQLLVGLPAEAGGFLERAAALGNDVATDEWETAIGLTALAPSSRLTGADVFAAWQRTTRVVEGLVDRLSAARLIEETPQGFQFRHAMLRESLERRARDSGRLTAHHRACAALLLERGGGITLAERIGRHHFLAGEPNAAIEPLLEGARHLMSTVGHRAALAVLGLAEEAVLQAHLPATDVRRGEALWTRAELLFRSGELQAGLDANTHLVEAAAAQGWEVLTRRALVQRVPALLFTSGPKAAEPVGAELVALASRAGDDDTLVAGLRALSDVVAQQRQPVRALDLAVQATALARRKSDPALLAQCLRTLGQRAAKQREFSRAKDAFEEAAELAEESLNTSAVADAFAGLGTVHRLSGRLGLAEDAYLKALEIMETIGAGNAVVCRFYLAMIRWLQGDIDAARPDLEGLLPLLAHRGWRRLAIGVHGVLCCCAAERGDWPAFDTHLVAASVLREHAELADEDVAVPLERAGEVCIESGKRKRAVEAWRLARDAWTVLGETQKAAALQQRIDA